MFTSGKLNGCSLKVCFDKVFGNYDKISNVIQTLCRFYLVTLKLKWTVQTFFGGIFVFPQELRNGFCWKEKSFLEKTSINQAQQLNNMKLASKKPRSIEMFTILVAL